MRVNFIETIVQKLDGEVGLTKVLIQRRFHIEKSKIQEKNNGKTPKYYLTWNPENPTFDDWRQINFSDKLEDFQNEILSVLDSKIK